MELVSTMSTEIDFARIEQEVGKYFRYATFSHKWENDEPLFEKVTRGVVYDLEGSPTHEKVKMFCKIVREAGFNWAWSDTCCINKENHVVLQEALVNMFKWYERSAMTIIFLRGVDRLAQRGALTKSIWNTRMWTLEEYHASKVVRFYTEDWTPYLGLDIYNHKESPEIISEMEQATGISAQALMALRPGLDDIREKLRLASTRQTTLEEDVAYALLGLFSISLPIVYGEGDQALGRLLAQLLASSGDTSILAWTGKSGSFNSCLPANITVFNQLPTSHIPPPLADAEMTAFIAGLRSLDLTLVMKLYDQLNELPVPSLSGQRMKLPCLTFKLGRVLASRNGSELVFRAQTSALGVVEIRAMEDFSQFDSLYLIHPWVDFLLDRQPVGSVMEGIFEERATDESSGELPSFPGPSNITPTRITRLLSALGLPFGRRSPRPSDAHSLLPPSTLSPVDKRMRVLQFITRLRQPFGALLLTPIRRNVEEYRRISAESLITVQVKEITPAILERLVHGVRMLDVL